MHKLIQPSVLFVLFLSISLLSLGGCHKQNIQQFIVQTPQMATAEDAEIIVAAAESVNGVLDASADLEQRVVVVRYNSLNLAEKNVETAIAKAGYDANSILALPEQSMQ